MAAHHIDCRAAPGLDDAVLNHEVVDAAQLDPVVIARGELGNVEPFDPNVVRGLRSNPAVVDVDPVARHPADNEVAEDDVAGLRDLECGSAVLDDRRVLLALAGDRDRTSRLAVDVGEEDPARVGARREQDRRSRRRRLHGRAQSRKAIDDDRLGGRMAEQSAKVSDHRCKCTPSRGTPLRIPGGAAENFNRPP